MKFKIDENLPVEIAEELRVLGYDALTVVEQDLPPAIKRHRKTLGKLGAKYQKEIVERELVPLVRKEVWPVVREHAEPLATEVGEEIWSKASLFSWLSPRSTSSRTRLSSAWQHFSRPSPNYRRTQFLPMLSFWKAWP